MDFKIIEENDGYIFNKKKYKWGDGLIELVNTDLTKLKEIQNQEVLDEDYTYGDYLSKFLKYDKNSKLIHYQLLKSVLNNYIDVMDNITENNSFLNTVINDKFNLQKGMFDFISPLFICQNKIKTILYCLSTSNNNSKKMSIDEKLYELTHKKNSTTRNNLPFLDLSLYSYENILDFSFTTTSNNIDLYNSSNLSSERITFTKSKKLQYIYYFSTVQEFVNYELIKSLSNSVKFLCCQNCGRFIITKDIRKKFCTEKCKKESQNKKLQTNPYYKEYNKTYKYLYNIKYDETFMKKLRSVYDEYKTNDNNVFDEKNFNSFKSKLEEIKIEFKKVVP